MTTTNTTAALQKYLSSYSLALAQDSSKGRKVVATSLIERGSIVTTSQPLGTVPLKAHVNEFCNYCFRKLGASQYSTTPLKRCSRCKSAYFCDMNCFKNAWLSYHQYVCRPKTSQEEQQQQEENHEEDVIAMDVEMLERVALNATRYHKRKVKMDQEEGSSNGYDEQQEGEHEEESVEVTMEAFESLVDHGNKHPRHVQEHFDKVAQRALSKTYLEDSPLTKQDLIRFMGRFRCNNFSIYDQQLFAIGEGTYPVASLFNHDCRPNAAILFDGALLMVKAIDDIEPGHEITVAYVDIAHSRRVRKQTLKDKYYFDCQCDRCRDDNPVGRIDAMLGEEMSDWDRAASLLQEENGDSDRARILQLLEKDWDLLMLTRRFNRHNNEVPDTDEPLTLPYYVHFLLPFLTPYLWAASNPGIRFVGGSTPVGSSMTIQHITEFDDPPTASARPYPGETYLEILGNAIDKTLSYKTPDRVIPYRITTLANCTRLFFDEMMDGHWRNATKLGMYILVQYAIIYPPYHPMLAQHLLLLAKSAWNSIIQNELVTQTKQLEKVQERGVRRWILLAKETIAHTFGKQSQMWREVIELEWIFIREQKLKK